MCKSPAEAMFGFLKKLGRKSEPTTPVSRPAPAANPPAATPARPATPAVSKAPSPPTSAPPKAPVAPPPRPSVAPAPVAAAPKAPLPAKAPAAAPAAAASAAKPAPAVEMVYSKETVDLPLKQLWAVIDPAITQSAFAPPDGAAMLRLPVNFVQAQLAKGAVKLSYAQLRQFSPEGLFNAKAAKEGVETTIPISEILPRLKPEHLSRRPGQKMVEVPADIGPIFGSQGLKPDQIRISQPEPKSAPTAAAAPSVAATAIKPASPEPIAIPTTISPTLAAAAAPAVEATAPAAVATPIAPPAADLSAGESVIKAPKLDPSLASLKAPTKPGEEVFPLSLMDVAAFWTENGKTELANLYRHSLEIPINTLQAALKIGKLQFQWREVRQWIRLAPGNTLPTISDDLVVELPLSLVAPRALEFLARSRPKKKVDLGEEIPDVFFRKSAPAAPAPTPAALAPSAPAPKSDGIPQFGEIFGKPEKQAWSLAEITKGTTTLRGIAGAIIATSDGLLVAGSWPGGVKSEAVAGFVPQMYSRMLQYTKELNLGEPGNVTLVIDEVPMQIFKTAKSYFTVLGRSGEPLPKPQLKAIASRLAETTSQN